MGYFRYLFCSEHRVNSFQYYFRWVKQVLPDHKHIHVVGLAAVIWAIWKRSNKVCFDHTYLKNPAEIICSLCNFLKYWAAHEKGELQEVQIQGTEQIQAMMTQHMRAMRRGQGIEVMQLVQWCSRLIVV